MKQFTIIAASEAKALWGLKSSTLNTTINRGKIPVIKSGGTNLVSTADIAEKFGPPAPEPCPQSGKFLQCEEFSASCSGAVPEDWNRLIFYVKNEILVVNLSHFEAAAAPPKTWLINSASIPADGLYKYDSISLEAAQEIIQESRFISRIGYPENAKLLSEATGCKIPVNREPHAMAAGDTAIVMKLPYRVASPKTKGKTTNLSIEQFEFGMLSKLE